MRDNVFVPAKHVLPIATAALTSVLGVTVPGTAQGVDCFLQVAAACSATGRKLLSSATRTSFVSIRQTTIRNH